MKRGAFIAAAAAATVLPLPTSVPTLSPLQEAGRGGPIDRMGVIPPGRFLAVPVLRVPGMTSICYGGGDVLPMAQETFDIEYRKIG